MRYCAILYDSDIYCKIIWYNITFKTYSDIENIVRYCWTSLEKYCFIFNNFCWSNVGGIFVWFLYDVGLIFVWCLLVLIFLVCCRWKLIQIDRNKFIFLIKEYAERHKRFIVSLSWDSFKILGGGGNIAKIAETENIFAETQWITEFEIVLTNIH